MEEKAVVVAPHTIPLRGFGDYLFLAPKTGQQNRQEAWLAGGIRKAHE